MKNEKMNVCDLYGGREKVIDLMTKTFKEAWREKMGVSEFFEEIPDFSQSIKDDLFDMGINPESMLEIINGNKVVDYDLFENLRNYLELKDFRKLVGEPVFEEGDSKNSRVSWEKEQGNSPMLATTGYPVPLELYLFLRLIAEISVENQKDNWWRAPLKERMQNLLDRNLVYGK